MQIESTLYYRHVDFSIMRKLDELLSKHFGDSKKFRQLAKRLHSSRGHLYADEFMHGLFDLSFDLHPDKIIRMAGFSIAHFQHGQYSYTTLEALMHFLKKLIPDLHIQAWAYHAEQTKEMWLKFEEKHLKCASACPLLDPSKDQECLTSIYPWWHATMPQQIHEGILNQYK